MLEAAITITAFPLPELSAFFSNFFPVEAFRTRPLVLAGLFLAVLSQFTSRVFSLGDSHRFSEVSLESTE
jgi:hypothetical protein